MKHPHCSSRLGQSALEYILLFGLVGFMVILAMSPNGFLNKVHDTSNSYFLTVSNVIRGDNPKGIDGHWCEWSGDSGNVQFRTCECPAPAFGGKPCEGYNQREYCKSCATADCKWSDWSDWSGCSKECGGGSQIRTRTIEVPAAGGGKDCVGPKTEERQPCNPPVPPCADNCAWSDPQWEGICPKPCGEGIKTRTSMMTPGDKLVGAKCIYENGPTPTSGLNGQEATAAGLTDSTTCTNGVCPEPGKWSAASCGDCLGGPCGGTGNQSCTVTCNNPPPSDSWNETIDGYPCPIPETTVHADGARGTVVENGKTLKTYTWPQTCTMACASYITGVGCAQCPMGSYSLTQVFNGTTVGTGYFCNMPSGWVGAWSLIIEALAPEYWSYLNFTNHGTPGFLLEEGSFGPQCNGYGADMPWIMIPSCPAGTQISGSYGLCCPPGAGGLCR